MLPFRSGRSKTTFRKFPEESESEHRRFHTDRRVRLSVRFHTYRYLREKDSRRFFLRGSRDWCVRRIWDDRVICFVVVIHDFSIFDVYLRSERPFPRGRTATDLPSSMFYAERSMFGSA